VYGDSAAALAAASELRLAGVRVALIVRHSGLLREYSWGFLQQAELGAGKAWARFHRVLESRGAWRDGRVSGACAEVVAGAFAREIGLAIRMYRPVDAVEIRGGLLRSATFLGRGRALRVTADHWVDASACGELVRRCGGDVAGLGASGWWHSVFFRHTRSADAPGPVDPGDPPPGILEWQCGSGFWPAESVISYREASGSPLKHLCGVLSAARERLPIGDALVTHASLVATPAPSREIVAISGVRNLLRPDMGIRDLGGLFVTGSQVAGEIREGRVPEYPEPGGPAPEASHEKFDVVVAGLGTGGALAALASARAGARVGAFEALPCVGGVGTSGGIHLYYFGVQGGIQSEVDSRIKDLVPLFGSRKQVAGFHPVAKICVLNDMLAESGVRVLTEASLGEVFAHGGKVGSCRILDGRAGTTWAADAWVDALGDGDLAAGAGADWVAPSRIDGVASAFTQASGWVAERDGLPYLRIVNFDGGFVNGLAADDLTRARLRGLQHYECERFTGSHHPTLIAPLIGVRQSRQIVADYMIGVADLASRASFPDGIGQSACHLDSHAVDFEFEPIEIAFWMWGCRNWRVRTACEIPYRSLRPRGLENVLTGCRSIGVTPEAHQSVRMQRDMQRVGEAAGLAAAFVAKFGISSRDVPLDWLHDRLRLSGALGHHGPEGTDFGRQVEADVVAKEKQSLEALLEATRADFGPHMFLLWSEGSRAIGGLNMLLREPGEVSWRAAVVLAMLGGESAEDRLVSAVNGMEVGFADEDPRHPARCQRLAPNWLAALVFLRNCGGRRSLAAAESLLDQTNPLHNVKTSCGLLAAAVVERYPGDVGIAACARRILQRLQVSPADNSIGAPQRNVLGVPGVEGDLSIWYPKVVEDFRWQLDLVRVRLASALGDSPPIGWQRHLDDPRGYVRKAFEPFAREAEGAGIHQNHLTGGVPP